jgi:hypothetical protein
MQQDIKAAVRMALFQSDFEEWPYSFGGTLFIVNFKGRCYGLTCYHVIGNEGANHLFVPADHIPAIGATHAPIRGVARVKDRESEIQDIAVISFTDDISPEFFGGTAYVVDQSTVGTSDAAHRLKVYGFLSTRTYVDYDAKSIMVGYCDLQFHDLGRTSSDPFIRQALATYVRHNLDSLDGISGAPVFDETTRRLCGMAVRAGLNDQGKATLWYIDISHIVRLVEAVHTGSTKLTIEIPAEFSEF